MRDLVNARECESFFLAENAEVHGVFDIFAAFLSRDHYLKVKSDVPGNSNVRRESRGVRSFFSRRVETGIVALSDDHYLVRINCHGTN